MALGATPSRIASSVLGEGAVLTAIGVGGGFALALAPLPGRCSQDAAGRVLRALLYEVSPTSAAEFAAATLLLVVVTFVAILLPARRAARTDPAAVLRGD